ncbi:abortive infection system antitoxin AbiGi family protein [Nitrosomonas sp.]|uniref:abortive infection system antitoxin AbiGi family protein n=1 Tax=Nitrosomonas sp. TaxID=42353 RepID=UPI0025D9624D|nr:abortive infection system antitoxin AbiGi family protein [Nitrosomonas sp.]
MPIISDNLIHFLARSNKDNPNKQFEIFKQIFENGLRASKVANKFPDGSCVLNHAVCFTDIPLKECNEHTSIYGKFGIGFKKSFVKNAGGNPARYFVDYIPGEISTLSDVNESRGVFYTNLWAQFRFIKKLNDALLADSTLELFDQKSNKILTTQELSELVASMLYTYSFDKEMGDLGPARDETKEIDLYYKEREWRLVPSSLDQLSGIVIQIQNDNSHYYKFYREDVNMVVVPNEDIRKKMLDYFLSIPNVQNDRLYKFKENLLPIIHYEDLQNW